MKKTKELLTLLGNLLPAAPGHGHSIFVENDAVILQLVFESGIEHIKFSDQDLEDSPEEIAANVVALMDPK